MSTLSTPAGRGSTTSSILPRTSTTLSASPLAATMPLACSTMPDMSTPITSLAPALAANMDRMPVPQPTSSTILSLNRCLFCRMAFM